MENKGCEICGKLLVGKQIRTCSRRCRNVIAGRVSTPRLQPIDRDWLREQYLLPPEGLGRSTTEIGMELGCTDVRVQQVVKSYGLTQNQRLRLSYFRKRQPSRQKKCPDLERLAELYQSPPEGQGKTQDEIAAEFGVSRPVVIRWLANAGLTEAFEERHSRRMSGTGNPAYSGGNAQGYVRKILARAKAKACEWCGVEHDLQIHHINHDRRDNDLNNLTWLCGPCNRLEAQLWILRKSGRGDWQKTGNKITVTF